MTLVIMPWQKRDEDDDLETGNDDVELAPVLHATMSGALGESKAKGAAGGGSDPLPQPKQWSMENFLKVVGEDYVATNIFSWKDVARSFDYVGFEVTSLQQFDFLMGALRDGISGGGGGGGGDPIPMSFFWGKWSNAKGQLSIFRHALSLSERTYSTSSSSASAAGASANGNKQISWASPVTQNTRSDGWSSPELIASLLGIAETENFQHVRQVFDAPIKQCPDILVGEFFFFVFFEIDGF